MLRAVELRAKPTAGSARDAPRQDEGHRDLEHRAGPRARPPARSRAPRRCARELFQRMREFMERYEFLLLPVNQVPPFPVDQPYVDRDQRREARQLHRLDEVLLPTSPPPSHPAISVPAGFTDEGAAGRPADRRALPRRFRRAAARARLRGRDRRMAAPAGSGRLKYPVSATVNPMPSLSQRAQSLGTENAFVVLAEVTALAAPGQGHHQLLHRPAGLPGAAARAGSGHPRDPRGQARLHALGGHRPAARGGGQVHGGHARRPADPGAGRGGRRRREALHRLRHPVDHRPWRRRRGDLPEPGLPDLRIADHRLRREAGAGAAARKSATSPSTRRNSKSSSRRRRNS